MSLDGSGTARGIYLGIGAALMSFWLSSAAYADDGDRWVCSFVDTDKTTGTPQYSVAMYKFEISNGTINQSEQEFPDFKPKYKIILDDTDNLIGVSLDADSGEASAEVLIIRKKALTLTLETVSTPVVLNLRIDGSCVHGD